MGSYTTAHFYRPGKPPIVTTGALAAFIERLLAQDALRPYTGPPVPPPTPRRGILARLRPAAPAPRMGPMHLSLKYGSAIDRDDRPTSWCDEEQVVAVVQEIKWDVDEYGLDAPAVLGILRGRDRPIYRAELSLGTLTDAVIDAIARRNSPENDRDLLPDSLGVQLEPFILCDPNEPEQYLLGYISVTLSGGGYLYPWTHRDYIGRLNACPEVQRLMAVCRETWPVTPAPPTPEVVAGRRQMGKLWGSDDYEAPANWRWGIQESW